MDPLFEELVSVSFVGALKFFLGGLQEIPVVTAKDPRVTEYVARVLAHYSLTSRTNTDSVNVTMGNLTEVFNCFISPPQIATDPDTLEYAGSLILLFAGFFRDQSRRRHNVRWYDELGQSFYHRASRYTTDNAKGLLWERLSESFPDWTTACCSLNRKLREDWYLLKL